MNEEYINAFEKYHSPMAAASFGLPQRQMAFDISQMNGDTLINVFGKVNYNEAEHFDVVFYKKEDGKTGMEINARQKSASPSSILNYSIEGKDTVLLLTITDENKTITQRFRNVFRKFPESDEVHLTALEYFVNVNLFAGAWKTNDGEKISFTPDGRVINFRNYKRYSITTSEENAASRPDEISFYNDSSGVTYSFIYQTPYLKFYEITESDDGLKFSVGKKVVELRKSGEENELH